MAEKREIPKAPRYPGFVDATEAARARYDLALAVAARSVDEPPTSAAALMAAQVVYESDIPTDA